MRIQELAFESKSCTAFIRRPSISNTNRVKVNFYIGIKSKLLTKLSESVTPGSPSGQQSVLKVLSATNHNMTLSFPAFSQRTPQMPLLDFVEN